MTVLALISAKHSPGVTTAALAFAAASACYRQTVLIEADPAGGDVAARAGLALDPGLVSLAAAGRHEGLVLDVEPHAQPLRAGGLVVVGPTTYEQASGAVATLAGRLSAGDAGRDDHLTIVDCGRWFPGSPAERELDGADIVLVVARPTLDALEHLRSRLAGLARAAGRSIPAVLLVGDGPYPSEEVSGALGVGVVGVLPFDPRGAAALLGAASARVARHSPLVRAARSILDRLDAATNLSRVGTAK